MKIVCKGSIKKILFIGMVLSLFLVGCGSNTSEIEEYEPRPATKLLICNPPFISDGDDCCADRNTNGLCDGT